MFFWKKKGTRRTEEVHISRAEKIVRTAEELRRVGSSELSGLEVVAALQAALSDEISAHVCRENPRSTSDQRTRILDQVLDGVYLTVRENAYLAANLPAPSQNYNGRDLTPEEFKALTVRIINEATKNNVSDGYALCAIAKALGFVIGMAESASADDLIKFAQNAVAIYAHKRERLLAEVAASTSNSVAGSNSNTTARMNQRMALA